MIGSPNQGDPSLAVGDVDGDGDLDLLTPLTFFQNDGHGRFDVGVEVRFQALSGSILPLSTRGVALGDVDGDGRLDALVDTILYYGDGAGGFLQTDAPLVALRPTMPYQNALVDLDGDGDLDALIFDTSYNERYVLRGDGGRFVEVSSVNPGQNLLEPVIGDLDADGDLDLALLGGQSKKVITFLNDGACHFAQGPSTTLSPVLSRGMVGTDLDGDGDMDLALVDTAGGLFELRNDLPGNSSPRCSCREPRARRCVSWTWTVTGSRTSWRVGRSSISIEARLGSSMRARDFRAEPSRA